MKTRQLNLIFPDGSIVSGKTFAELEDALRASQWRTYKTRRDFRRAMRERARTWSGFPFAKPIIYQTPKGFIYQLVNAGLCMIEEGQLTTTDDDHTTTTEQES